jgi:histidinol-phosphatase (PHP family)
VLDITVDGHIHTRLCHHASGEMEDYVLAGIERGLRQIIFLEHLEVGVNYFESTWLTDDDFAYYHAEGKRLQEKYQGVITVGLGVEVGYNPRYLKEIRQRLALHTWDRIGISYHFLETDAGYLNMVSSKQVNIDRLRQFGVDEVLKRYYSTLLEAVEKLDGNVLCHIDAALRHNPELRLKPEHYELLDQVLDAIARKNMALEINTSGYKTRNTPYPAPIIIKKALERDVALVAGSDAHRPADVGRYFERLPELMKELEKN